MSDEPNTSVEALERLAYQALMSGGRAEGSRYVEWDISGNCRNPVRVNRYSRASENPKVLREGRRKADPFAKVIGRIGDIIVPWHEIKRVARVQRLGMEVTLLTECRRCDECLRKRAARWRFRAVAECEAAPRTWFGTLTLRPEEHYKIDALLRLGVKDAKGRYRRQPVTNWHELTDEARARLRIAEVNRELTLWLKRVRKNSGCQFRYLAVTEIHTGEGRSAIKDPETRSHCITGFPHLHLLVHEVPGQPLLKKFLAGRQVAGRWETLPTWKLGFTKWKLLPPDDRKKGAMYLCKYLSKAMDARVRASEHYGSIIGSSDDGFIPLEESE